MTYNLMAGLPEEAFRFTQLPNEQGHNAVWEFKRSPEGRFFLSVCGENELPLSAILYEYYPRDGRLRKIFDVDREWIVDREQMPPSKVHTSLDFLPDGRLIMATHNTAPAPGHPRWLFEQHYEDPWQGYPGSVVMLVDPDTGIVQVRGIPVPRESIYGGLLGRDPRYYYFLGYMRGHFYRLDLLTNAVRDYGKVTEYASFRLIRDDRGRIYGGTYSGELWRYDPEKDAVEDTKARFISPHGTRSRRQCAYSLKSPSGSLFFAGNVDGELLELDPETLAVTRHGYMHLREDARGDCPTQAVGGLEADDNFCLYYGLVSSCEGKDVMRLMRWDVLHGGEPENLGLVAPYGKESCFICEMLFDGEGLLHLIEVCGPHSPYLLAVDVNRLSAPGPDAPPTRIVETPPPAPPIGEERDFHPHIEAERIRVLPLHNFLPWRETAVRHAQLVHGQPCFLTGTHGLHLLRADFEDLPGEIITLCAGESAASCLALAGGRAAVITSRGDLLHLDLAAGTVVDRIPFPAELGIDGLHGQTNEGSYLISGSGSALFLYRPGGQPAPLGITLASPRAAVVPISAKEFLLSGTADAMLRYDIATGTAALLDILTPAVKGRAFRSVISGGLALDDGTALCGTDDGILFTLSPDLSSVVSYGRLFSTGGLRGFIPAGSRALAIYGGPRDAGHVVSFSRETGLVDLGRPRMLKDYAQLAAMETEIGSIHEIACLLYHAGANELYAASGELFGCIIRYSSPH
jgi:hypothetical protein